MFELDLDVIGVDELEAAVAEADDEFISVVAEGVEAGLQDAVAKVKQTHPYQDHSESGLTASIGSHLESAGPSGATGVIEATAPYASYVDEGTDAHDIEAADGGVLAWQEGGTTRFARRVHHPGTDARPFMQPAADDAGERAAERIEQAIESRVKPILEKK